MTEIGAMGKIAYEKYGNGFIDIVVIDKVCGMKLIPPREPGLGPETGETKINYGNSDEGWITVSRELGEMVFMVLKAKQEDNGDSPPRK